MSMFTAKGDLQDQPSKAPTRKVGASGAIGLLVVIALSVVGGLGVEVPGVNVDELPVGEAFTGLVMFITAYMARERT